MAASRWTPLLLLAFLLSARSSLGAVDSSWLTHIVEGLKNEYPLGDAFSLAANIPENQDGGDLQQVLQDDPVGKVREAVSQGQVYQGARVVAATQTGGFSRVLENIQPLIKSSQGNVLVIYSEASPNVRDNKDEGRIRDIVRNWGGYAFAFSRVADAPNADASQLAQSFKLQQISKLGLDNIFRCYEPGDSFECTSCSSGQDVAPSCLANSAPSNQEQGQEEEAGTPESDRETGGDTGDTEVSTDTHTGNEITTGAGTGLETPGKAGAVGKYKGRRDRGCKRRGGRQRKKGCKVRRRRKRGRGKKGRKRGSGRKRSIGGKRGSGRKRSSSRKLRRGRRGKSRRRGGKRWGELLDALQLF